MPPTDSQADSATAPPPQATPLYDLHIELAAKMVPFAGYQMPLHYAAGMIKEHQHTRTNAGLFDVSHMGQARLVGPDHATTAAALERLVPGAIASLKPGAMRYTQLTNKQGGIIDDLMVTRRADPGEDGRLYLVVNAACKTKDYAHIAAHLPADVTLETFDDLALIALQGPAAGAVMASLAPDTEALTFMKTVNTSINGMACGISRAGYTGEDGFEISIAADQAAALARLLLADDRVQPAGLGARDSLRLEAGLCLYGHDIDDTTSPVEAALVWSIGKKRRETGGFIGDDRILQELKTGPARKLVGIRPAGRVPAREGSEILNAAGEAVGRVTSGGFGATVNGPVAMGYVPPEMSKPGTPVQLAIRGRAHEAEVAALPFVPHRYKRQ